MYFLKDSRGNSKAKEKHRVEKRWSWPDTSGRCPLYQASETDTDSHENPEEVQLRFPAERASTGLDASFSNSGLGPATSEGEGAFWTPRDPGPSSAP